MPQSGIRHTPAWRLNLASIPPYRPGPRATDTAAAANAIALGPVNIPQSERLQASDMVAATPSPPTTPLAVPQLLGGMRRMANLGHLSPGIPVPPAPYEVASGSAEAQNIFHITSCAVHEVAAAAETSQDLLTACPAILTFVGEPTDGGQRLPPGMATQLRRECMRHLWQRLTTLPPVRTGALLRRWQDMCSLWCGAPPPAQAVGYVWLRHMQAWPGMTPQEALAQVTFLADIFASTAYRQTAFAASLDVHRRLHEAWRQWPTLCRLQQMAQRENCRIGGDDRLLSDLEHYTTYAGAPDHAVAP